MTVATLLGSVVEKEKQSNEAIDKGACLITESFFQNYIMLVFMFTLMVMTTKKK